MNGTERGNWAWRTKAAATSAKVDARAPLITVHPASIPMKRTTARYRPMRAKMNVVTTSVAAITCQSDDCSDRYLKSSRRLKDNQYAKGMATASEANIKARL